MSGALIGMKRLLKHKALLSQAGVSTVSGYQGVDLLTLSQSTDFGEVSTPALQDAVTAHLAAPQI